MKPTINQVILSGFVKEKPELLKKEKDRYYTTMKIGVKNETESLTGENEVEDFTVLMWDEIAKRVIEIAEVGDFVALKGMLIYPDNSGKCAFMANKVFLLEDNE